MRFEARERFSIGLPAGMTMERGPRWIAIVHPKLFEIEPRRSEWPPGTITPSLMERWI